jgi:hypothetical protein
MFAKRPLNDLAERRRLLKMEADLLRGFIRLDRTRLREQLAGFMAAGKTHAFQSPWLIAGGALARVLSRQHWRKLAMWIPAVMTTLRWVHSLKHK